MLLAVNRVEEAKRRGAMVQDAALKRLTAVALVQIWLQQLADAMSLVVARSWPQWE